MDDFDIRLRTLLDDEAAALTPDRTRLQSVVSRVRRRRAARALGAGVAACAVVAGGFAGGGAVLSSLDRPRPHVAAGNTTPPGPAQDEPRVFASGTFEGREWTLTIVYDPDAAHPEDTESDNPEILFEIEGAEPNAGSFETYGSWDGLSEPFYTELSGDDAFVMGMVDEAAASVTVETDAGESIPADVFDGDDEAVRPADYYLAFLSAGATGRVVARDGSGDTIATASLTPPPDRRLTVGCHGEEGAEDEEPDAPKVRLRIEKGRAVPVEGC